MSETKLKFCVDCKHCKPITFGNTDIAVLPRTTLCCVAPVIRNYDPVTGDKLISDCYKEWFLW